MPEVGITISPPVSLLSVDYRYQDFYDRIDPVLRRMCKSYILYPEFDPKGRMHFHGVLHDYDEIKYFKTQHLLNRIGWTKIEQFKTPLNKIRWVMYCQKEWRKTTRIINECKPLFKKHLSRKAPLHSLGPKTPNIYDYFN